MIKRYLMLLFILTGLSSCEATVRPYFEKMSEAELSMYNASLSMDDQIICREDIEGWRILSGAISSREEIEGSQGSWTFFSQRTQPKFCFSVQQLKRAQRNAERGFGGIVGGGFVGGAGYGSFSDGGRQPADAADYPSTFNN